MVKGDWIRFALSWRYLLLPHTSRHFVQAGVHGTLFRLQTHLLVLQSDLQPHLSSLEHASYFGGNSDQYGSHPAAVFCHPQCWGDVRLWCNWSAFPHKCPAWYTALLMCLVSALFVGGTDVSGRSPPQNKICRASFTVWRLASLVYMAIAYFSSVGEMVSTSSREMGEPTNLSAFVTFSSMPHADHAVLLPRVAKKDTESHPVNALKPRNASALSRPDC